MAAPAKVDVVVVGGGASAVLLAAKLGAAGKKIVILEQGPGWELTDLISSQIWSRRLKWGGQPVFLEGKNPVGYNYNTGWGTGGAALHHFANWPRMHPEDFRMKSLYDRGLDWPISYDDLRPYYDRIQDEVGISGDHVKEVWRPAGAPYPMPPTKVFRHAELLAEGFKTLGLRVAPMPVAINSVAYRGRAACIYDGWCEAGCPIGALANPHITYLPQAKKTGAEIRTHSYVTRVLVDAKGRRVVGVEYFNHAKQRHVQHADVVVLAAFAAENPRILFNSATSRHPNGLANSSGLLGRYVMTHVGANVWGLFDEAIDNHLGLSAALLMSQEGYVKTSRKEAFGSYTWTIGVAQKPNDILGMANARVPVFGTALHDFMKRAARGLAKIQAVAEEVPNPDNRVVLGDRQDAFGLPLARVIHSLDDNALKLFHYTVAEGLRIMKATRAAESWPGPFPNLIHMAGGTVMGGSHTDSVTDSYGRTHDIPNLFITGAGLFPTEAAVHPTFTVHALALRTADYMIRNWRAVAH